MAMKEYSIFPKATGQEPHYLMQFRIQDIRWNGDSYSYAVMHLYCIAPADWAVVCVCVLVCVETDKQTDIDCEKQK